MNGLTLTIFCDPLLYKRSCSRVKKETDRYLNEEISINGKRRKEVFFPKYIKGIAKHNERLCSIIKKKAEYK